MYKVAIIDDEPIIRKGIRNVINWQSLGCEVCGEAEDGESGADLVTRMKPEIIITDIKMPEVDGLTMISRIKSVVPDSKLIILTGYRNFDYAQTALRLGAFDFLLKPSRIEDLTSCVRRAAAELKSDSERLGELSKMRRRYEESKPLIRERVLYNLIHGVFEADDAISDQAEELELRIGSFILGIADNEGAGADTPEAEAGERARMYQYGISGSLGEAFGDKFGVSCLPLGDRQVAFVLSASPGTALELAAVREKAGYLQKIIRDCFGFTITVAFSGVGSGFRDLPAEYRRCREALEHRFYCGGSAVIFYDDLQSLAGGGLPEECRTRLLDAVRAGDIQSVHDAALNILQEADRSACADRRAVRGFYFNTIVQIGTIRSALPGAEERPAEGAGMLNLYSMIESCENIGDLNGLLEQVALQVAEKVKEYHESNTKLLLRRAMEYIESHYAEDITLNHVAENIYVSTFYISRMFKKELGINFVDYLNEIRIRKAKELLRDSRYKTYEVAEAVGIPNAHYFSKIFRKYTGMTASEFKSSM